MAKNLSTFQPGSKKAEKDITYKTIIMSGAWAAPVTGHATNEEYGNPHYYINQCDTLCNNNFKKDETDVFLYGAGGGGGGACCCMQSSGGGEAAFTVKYSPRFYDDSDHFFMCVSQSCGCCKTASAGQSSRTVAICHTYGGNGGTAVNYVCACRTQGSPTCCQWVNNNNCCNYGAILPSGMGNTQPCWRQGGSACCYTTCEEKAISSCDAGYDCVYCTSPGLYRFEAGSCTARSGTGICGTPEFSGVSNWKKSAFRNGTIMVPYSFHCQCSAGRTWQTGMHSCWYGVATDYDNYFTHQLGHTGTSVYGGPCCCGNPGSATMSSIRYYEPEE